LDDGKWPATAHVKDNRNLNRGYGTANMAERNKLTKLLAHALKQIQGPSVRDKSNDKCKECGQLGHWARDCPRPRDKGRAPFNSPLRKGQRVPVRNGQPKRGMKRSKFPPPRSGESKTRTGPNGKTYYWPSAFRVHYKPGKVKSANNQTQALIDVILGVTAVITTNLLTKVTLLGLIVWMHIEPIRLRWIRTNPWIHDGVQSYLEPMIQVLVRRSNEIRRLNTLQN